MLLFAGFDPLGGAGILADRDVCRDFGVDAACVPTALVPQNSHGVRGVWPADSASIAQAVDALATDRDYRVAKVGVIGSAANAEVIRRWCARVDASVVVDPVLTGGTADRPVLGADAVDAYWRLAPHTTLITPNVEEARALLAFEGASEVGLEAAPAANAGEAPGAPGQGSAVASALARRLRTNVLVTGGHSKPSGTDILADAHGNVWAFAPQELPTDACVDVHGTGCHLSSAIAALLARGWGLHRSIEAAKRYVEQLFVAAQWHPGQGRPQFRHGSVSAHAAQRVLRGPGGAT